MTHCDQVRRLAGAYWDDEVTQAEREWFDAHLAGCDGCRTHYEGFARALELAGALPRVEMAADLPERALAAARRATAVPDRVVIVSSRPAWVPIAAAAGVLVVAGVMLAPMLGSRGPATPTGFATRTAPVSQPRLVAVVETAAPAAPAPTSAAKPAVATRVSDEIFDHAEDVEFLLDPVVLHRGRAQAVAHMPAGVQGEQTVISF